jgi:hypothetical protein
MKLQGSEVQDHETLQSQIGKIAENRLPLSGLEIFHGRLRIVLYAEPANSRDGSHTLREADEAAVHRPSQGATTILRAPGIVLRLRRSA